MSDRAWVATRKGLFELRRRADGWRIGTVRFLGEPVTAVLPADPAAPSRPMIVALALGHFGAKCHASADRGETWYEVAVPLSWQITPVALTEAIADPDPAAAGRAFDAMMQMSRIDIAAIEAARRG